LIADTVEEGRVGRAMGIVSIQLNMGLFLGPMLGGIIYDKVGWYGVFELGCVFLGLDIVLRLVMIEKHVAAQFQPSSNMTEEQSLPSEVQFLTPAKGKSTKSPEVIRLLKYPRMIAGMWLALAQATIISAFDAALPLHLNRLFGWTSFQAGISLLSLSILTSRFGVFGHCHSTILHRSTFRMDVRYLGTQIPCIFRHESSDPVSTSPSLA